MRWTARSGTTPPVLPDDVVQQDVELADPGAADGAEICETESPDGPLCTQVFAHSGPHVARQSGSPKDPSTLVAVWDES